MRLLSLVHRSCECFVRSEFVVTALFSLRMKLQICEVKSCTAFASAGNINQAYVYYYKTLWNILEVFTLMFK